MYAYRFRIWYCIVGSVLPNLILVLASALDERSVLYDVPLYALVVLGGMASAPAWLLPVKGWAAVGLVTVFWGVVGFLVGARADASCIKK